MAKSPKPKKGKKPTTKEVKKFNPDLIENIEDRELIQILIDHGYEEDIQIMMENESLVYTKKGRLNKSGACRALGLKTKQLEDKLLKFRQILEGREEEGEEE